MRVVAQLVSQYNEYFLFYIYIGRQGIGSIIIEYIALLTTYVFPHYWEQPKKQRKHQLQKAKKAQKDKKRAAEAAEKLKKERPRGRKQRWAHRLDFHVMRLRFDDIHFYGI